MKAANDNYMARMIEILKNKQRLMKNSRNFFIVRRYFNVHTKSRSTNYITEMCNAGIQQWTLVNIKNENLNDDLCISVNSEPRH